MHKLKLISAFVILLLSTQISFAQRAVDREKPFVGIDVGGASGSYNGRSYSEFNLGVNLNFTDWFTWRNSAFKRFSSLPEKDITGLDSTLRLISTTPIGAGTFGVFGGAGYRFADPSEKNALLAEGGVGINFGGFGLGAGAKYFKYDKKQLDSTGIETKGDETSYFFTVSGGTGFNF